MKSNDIIRSFERSLLVQFGSTGELQSVSTLRLDNATFSREGNAIRARYHDGGESFLVERFSSEMLAITAFQHLEAAVRRYARYRRIACFGKGVMKWGLAPVSFAILALAINMVATRAVGGNPGELESVQGAAPLVPVPGNLAELQRPIAAGAAVGSSELAKAMADGVRSGRYSVRLSQGTKGTLYVFSDPSCPHCQDLERELDKLGKDYTIYIFPVTVIGGEGSSHRLAKVLCAKPDARGAAWKRVVGGDDLEGAECAEGKLAVSANDEFFRVMGFGGTPTIINGAGEQPPDFILNTADAIGQWMSARK